MATQHDTDNLTAREEESAGEEEARITSQVVEQVGIDVERLTALMLLESVKQFGPQKFKDLHRSGLAPAEVLEHPERLLLGGKRAEGFRKAISELGPAEGQVARRRAVRQIVRACENDARILTYDSPHYPQSVFESNNPVPVLYLRGSVEALRSAAIACVGSREIRPPYDRLHGAFSKTAVREHFAIASGFATGADRIGHEVALRQGGQTILVMPCGLDRPFPPENKDLWTEFLSYPGAAIASEFPFGTKAATLTLRKRNKLIVAFARGVLLSQSSARGGAMNAYNFAIEQRKPVATFAADGTEQTSGNVKIAQGPPPPKRSRHPDEQPLFGRLPLTTVFPADRDTPEEWTGWLRQLLSSST